MSNIRSILQRFLYVILKKIIRHCALQRKITVGPMCISDTYKVFSFNLENSEETSSDLQYLKEVSTISNIMSIEPITMEVVVFSGPDILFFRQKQVYYNIPYFLYNIPPPACIFRV